MDKREFSQIRYGLRKTQKQMAQLLGTSPKAIQSFEQGWRSISVHIERQALFLLALNSPHIKRNNPCWNIRNCTEEIRHCCPAWEFKAGNICWFINGTICHGKIQESWRKKMKICRQCGVFRFVFDPLLKGDL